MESEKREGGDEGRSLWAETGQYMGFGLTWALSVLLFLMVGWWIDGKIGTEPLFMILGAFLGAGAGFYSLYQHVIAAGERRSDGRDRPER